MKAVIVECSNGAAVALCDDGSFRKLKNKGYSIGQELLLQQKASANHIMQKLSICASLALVLLSFAGIGSYSYAKPYSFVSLDINPSIEYALNRYDKVISVSGINDEGQHVVSSIESDVKNQNITTALGVTIRQLEKENYIVEQEYNHIIVSICSANDTKAKSIASRVDTFSVEETKVCSIDTMTVSKEVKDNADSLGITPGKLALIHAVAETTADSNFNVAEWTDKSVSELETTIQQASSQPSSPVTGPAAVTVINSEYLSSVLDEDITQKVEALPSAEEADTETGSTLTDQQTNSDNQTTAGLDTNKDIAQDTGASTSKPDNAGSTADNSPAKNENTSSTDNTNLAGSGNAANHVTGGSNTTADNNASSNSSVPESSGSTSNSSNAAGTGNSTTSNSSTGAGNTGNGVANPGTTAQPSDKDSGADTEGNNDSLTEDSSSKKDPYQPSDTNEVEDSSIPAQEPPTEGAADEEPTNTDESVNHGEAQGFDRPAFVENAVTGLLEELSNQAPGQSLTDGPLSQADNQASSQAPQDNSGIPEGTVEDIRY